MTRFMLIFNNHEFHNKHALCKKSVHQKNKQCYINNDK